jgi:hypothetical protein
MLSYSRGDGVDNRHEATASGIKPSMNNARKRKGIKLNMVATIRIIDAVTAADMKALCET